MTARDDLKAGLKLTRWLIFGLARCVLLVAPVLRADEQAVAETLLAPAAPTQSASAAPLSAFEKKFRADTGEGESTPRTEIQRAVSVKVGAKEKRIFKFDFAAWSDALRSKARLWIAVAAPSTITTEGPLRLEFSQGGVSMSTAVDHTFNVDGVILLGCDYAVRDGEVALEIDNGNHLADVPCTIHVIVYAPRKVAAP